MIFVDTSLWVGALNARDSRHDDALRLLKTHRDSALLTSNHVIGETWTFLRRRLSHTDAIDFLDGVDSSPGVAVEHVTPPQEQAAWAWLRHHDEREYSFVDATSFQLMRSNRITEALAFDGDFSAAGFVELRP